MNVAILWGRLSSDPRVTTLESGDVLVRYEVTVAHDDGPADSVPVAWLGAASAAPSDDLTTGDEVVVVGKVRRRWFRPAAGPSRSATEVVAATVLPATDRRRVRAALTRAAATVNG
jgi:single-stranded DNA-binding protein